MLTALQAALVPQFAAGLERIHLSVRPGPGMTPDKVAAEFLEAELAIAEGRVRTPPQPTSALPAHIAALVAAS